MQRPSLHLASDSLTTGTTPSVVHCDRFSLLPDDVLHVMLSFFGIVDLVRIRQCSRHLNHLSRARVVWLQQLRALCSYINLPPLALGPESLTNACLERYVTAHLRFTYNARRWSGHTEHQNVSLPSKASMRVNVLGYLDSPHDRITCIRFLPGGRYALVLSYSHLMLWDTGISVCAARCITFHTTTRPARPHQHYTTNLPSAASSSF
ncbi:hypothetical protein DL96DRAFT_17664 [Flagelloscypha sp. PMI_526]|nr:hypothetical protein DL96DRAFT_17664 [Flagelloscypha sp. PMI_526]